MNFIANFNRRVALWRMLAFWLCCFALATLFLAPAAHAQETDWRERQTSNFAILYTPSDSGEAERYAGFVDTIYDELATIFSHRVQPPITLRLYPTLESYYQVNPAARNLAGVVAHADFRRREVVVVVEQTRNQPASEIPNNIRHELTHIIAADMSGNRLNTGFQEGIAQYLEQSSPDLLQQKVFLLTQARDQGWLLPWSDFDNRDAIYNNARFTYPQTLSVVAFLVERDGFGKFREFLTISGRSSGYRSALERAYGVSATELEQQWRDWLPSYIAGGYQRNALSSYDLAYPRQLVEQGRYTEAQRELEQAIAWLRQNAATQSAETLAEAEQLLERSQSGQRAEDLALASRAALEQADYERASQLIAQARDAYAALGDTRQNEVLDAYAALVARGLSANAQLAQADALARTLRFPQARAAVDAAAAEFAALGDRIRLESALALRQALDTQQRIAGAVLVGLGMLGLGLSLLLGIFRQSRELW